MIQSFKFSRLNSDVISHEINTEEGEYRMMENLVPAKSGRGMGRNRESLPGTTLIDSSLALTTHKVIGKFGDAPNNKLYYFMWEESGFPRKDKIYAYDANTKTTELIVESEQLGWTEGTKITGISVLDGVIYWADPNLCYYRIQDNSQFSEIDYNCRAQSSAILENFYFVAEFQTGLSVNFQTYIQGPFTAVEAAQQVAADMAADASISSRFSVNVNSGSSVIKLVSIIAPGSIRLIGTPETYFNYYQTNFNTEPSTLDDFYQYPTPPKYRPLVQAVVDPNITINKILDKNWQFATRQIYQNNQVTVLSPFSEVIPSAKFIEDFTNTNIPNTILVQISITKPEKVKSVDILARNSDNSDWFIIKTLHRAELFASNGIMTYEFSGQEQSVFIPVSDAIKQQEGTPRQSIDLQIQRNKIFAIDNLTGYDYDDSNMSITIEINEEDNNPDKQYFKQGGLYNVAVRFFDDDFRTDGTVHAVNQVNIPENPSTSWATNSTNSGKLTSRMQYLNLTLNGQPPIWAKHLMIVRSDELRYSQFMQFHAPVLYYVRPEVELDSPNAATDEFYMYGNQYKEKDSINSISDWRYIHLLLPTNLPFIPERGHIVHIMAGKQVGAYDQTTILDVRGNIIVLEQPVDIVSGCFGVPELFIEIYKPKLITETNNFYEISGTYDIINPGTPTRSFPSGAIRINGDVWVTNNEDERLQWKYDWDDYTKNGSTQEEKRLRKSGYRWGNFESRSKSYTATQLIDEQTTEANRENPFSTSVIVEFTADFGFILNYNLSSKNLGRPAPLLQNIREEERPSTIRFSNDYIANSAINGLHTFEPLNEYPLPIERGPINKLQAAGEDVLLAIHSSAVTSMYIGKGIIRSADLNPTLITTDDVIGADNQLKYSYGTIHPESVCEVDGNVFFWDGRRNEPVRYAQNGLTPLATKYGARVLFQDTIPSLFGSPNTYSCITEYDRLLNMVYWTFLKGSTKYTIGFHESSNSWIGTYSFAPELYGSVGDHLIGFVNGMPWLHNDNSAHQTFYGVLYASKLKVDVNIGEALEKAWDGLYIDSNVKWDVPMIYNEDGQSTNLIDDDFILKDNLQYADFLRDINTPVAKLKPGQIALRHGNPLSSHTLTLELEYTGDTPHYIRSMGVAATYKSGHLLKQQ